MTLKPLNDRSSSVLSKELDNLKKTRDKCAEIFGPHPNINEQNSLDKITDAIDAIGQEIDRRRNTP